MTIGLSNIILKVYKKLKFKNPSKTLNASYIYRVYKMYFYISALKVRIKCA